MSSKIQNEPYEMPEMVLYNPAFSKQLGVLRTAHNVKAKFRFGSVSELSFTLEDTYTDTNNILQTLPYYEEIKKNNCILTDTDYPVITAAENWEPYDSDTNSFPVRTPAEISQNRWIITDVNETDDGSHKTKEVTCYSYEHTLKYRDMTLSEGTYALDEIISGVLETIPLWKCVIHPKYCKENGSGYTPYRTFSKASSNIYTFLTADIEKMFECITVFDNLNMTIYILPFECFGQDSGVILGWNNVMKETKVNYGDQEIITALHLKSQNNNDYSVGLINPVGTDVIYNFDDYMNNFSETLFEELQTWLNKINILQPYYKVLSERWVYKKLQLQRWKTQAKQYRQQIKLKCDSMNNMYIDPDANILDDYDESVEDTVFKDALDANIRPNGYSWRVSFSSSNGGATNTYRTSICAFYMCHRHLYNRRFDTLFDTDLDVSTFETYLEQYEKIVSDLRSVKGEWKTLFNQIHTTNSLEVSGSPSDATCDNLKLILSYTDIVQNDAKVSIYRHRFMFYDYLLRALYFTCKLDNQWGAVSASGKYYLDENAYADHDNLKGVLYLLKGFHDYDTVHDNPYGFKDCPDLTDFISSFSAERPNMGHESYCEMIQNSILLLNQALNYIKENNQAIPDELFNKLRNTIPALQDVSNINSPGYETALFTKLLAYYQSKLPDAEKYRYNRTELERYIYEGTFQNEYIVFTDSDVDEKNQLNTAKNIVSALQDLYNQGKIRHKFYAFPTFEFSLSMLSVSNLQEFDPILRKLCLGKTAIAEVHPGEYQKPLLLEMYVNYENPDNGELVFSNNYYLKPIQIRFADIYNQIEKSGSVNRDFTYDWTQ